MLHLKATQKKKEKKSILRLDTDVKLFIIFMYKCPKFNVLVNWFWLVFVAYFQDRSSEFLILSIFIAKVVNKSFTALIFYIKTQIRPIEQSEPLNINSFQLNPFLLSQNALSLRFIAFLRNKFLHLVSMVHYFWIIAKVKMKKRPENVQLSFTNFIIFFIKANKLF